VLISTSIKRPIQTSLGKYETIVSSFTSTSDTPLTGKLLRVLPALYLSDPTLDPQPNSKSFQVIYPASGSVELTTVADIRSKNYKVSLEVIDAYSFKLTYSFFVSRSAEGYVLDNLQDNRTLFDSSAFDSNVVLHVDINNTTAKYVAPIQVNACGLKTDFGVTGYTPGTDLEFEISYLLKEVNNNFYFGFYREDIIGNNSNFVKDSGLNYALIDSGVNQVDSLPYASITDGSGFVSGVGKITIDGATLLSGATYKAYVVYQYNGSWFTCISGSITQSGATIPITLGNLSSLITDELGGTTTLECIEGISSCANINACVTLDKVSYGTNLTANGITGVFSDYFVKGTVTVNGTTNAVGGTAISSVTTDNANDVELCVDYMPTEGFIGQKYLVFKFEFDYGSHKDEIIQIIELRYNVVETVNVLDDVICSETAGSQIFTVTTGSGCLDKTSVNGSPFVTSNIVTANSGSSLTIDSDLLSVNDELTVKSICDGTTGTDAIDDTCSDRAIVNIVQRTTVLNDAYSVELLVSGSYDSIVILASGLIGNNTLIGSGVLISGSTGFGSLPSYPISYTVTVTVNGNSESYSFSMAQGNEVANGIYETVNNTTTDINCVADTLCSENVAGFEITCDEATQTITIVQTQSFSSVVENDTSSMTTDGVTFAAIPASVVGEEKVFLQRDVTFADGCDPISIQQTVTCLAEVECTNTRDITIAYDSGNTELDITFADTISSTKSEDILRVSIDGGLTFQEYDLIASSYTSIAIDGNETVVVENTVKFADGCADLVFTETVNLAESFVDCDYSTYTATMDAYDADNEEFAVSFTGDETALIVNEKYFTLDGSNPFDEEGNIKGIPYEGVVNAVGQFIIGWRVQKENCNPEIIYAYQYVSGLSFKNVAGA